MTTMEAQQDLYFTCLYFVLLFMCVRAFGIHDRERSMLLAYSFERDMTTMEAQQDLYFMVFSALLNISVLKSAQPMIAKKGLMVLLGTSTLLYNRISMSE